MKESLRDFQELMLRVQQGSNEASRELLERYGPHVKRVVRQKLSRKLRAKFDSDDFAQAVWASFFAEPKRDLHFDRPEALLAYLLNLAQNKVVDVHRQRQSLKYDISREQTLNPMNLDTASMAASQATPSQYVMADEEWDRLLELAPAPYRSILVLLRQGHSHEEIAKIVGVSAKTIGRLLKRIQPGLPPK
jgi:RNA polymerase sigma factor (sigma-70 family)